MHAIRKVIVLSFFCFLCASLGYSQSSPEQLEPILDQKSQSSDIAAWLLRKYGVDHVPSPVYPQTAGQWAAETKRMRQHLLQDVVFHGWPKEWVDSSPEFEDLGFIKSGDGYRIRKLRYNIIPGFQSAAIVYEPERIEAKLPAILNVTGHVGPPGKSVEYIQKQAINLAKHGVLTLSLEWLNCGELSNPENDHDFASHLDLVGVNGVGLFYLAMRRGLDYLYQNPNVDPSRIGMTGLSGGAWQTLVLSSLDERVTAAIPVAGFASIVSIMERPGGDDLEEFPTDFFIGFDYTQLTAMRAPRPTLLIYNAEDDCCWRASLVKPYVFDQVQPYFSLFGKADNFTWHENIEPGTHNYQLDNRMQSYHFFVKHLHLPPIESEIPVAAEIKSYDELRVGLPKDNLTILQLAEKLTRNNTQPPIPSLKADRDRWASAERDELRDLVRYHPTSVKHPWALANTKNKGVETRSYLFEMSNELIATGVWLKGTTTPDNAPITVIISDTGKKAAADRISDLVNRGEQVLAIDLLFFGDAKPEKPGPEEYAHMLATIGDRPLGIEAAQLVGISRWLMALSKAERVRLESIGIRSQVVALLGSALEPKLFDALSTRGGMHTLKYLLDKPVNYEDAPDLFCLDLYKKFDIDRLVALVEPTKLTQYEFTEIAKK
jgi:dienelactone hydrolase